MTNHNTHHLTNRVLCLARSSIGIPYVAQADNLSAGCDCLGFVYGVLRAAGVPNLPPLAQLRQDNAWPLWPWQCASQRRAGDVLLLQWLGGQHVAIADTPHSMLHACVKRGVCREDLGVAWTHRLRGCWTP